MEHWVTFLYKVFVHCLIEEITKIACLFEISHPQNRMSS